MKGMSFRKIVSLTSLTCFCFLLITGVILYVVPQGRVAYWANWRLFGLGKEEWTALHINLSLLFLIASGFHIYYNWKPIVAYLKNRAKQVVVFTREFSVALFVALLFAVATYFGIQPFQGVLDINEKIKAGHEKAYGVPPYGHAELSSLGSFCRRLGLDPERSAEILVRNNIRGVDKKATLKEMAKANETSPQKLYQLIKEARVSGAEKPSGGAAAGVTPVGLGRKTLEDAAGEYGLDLTEGISRLARHKIEAQPGMTFRELADRAGMDPVEVFDIMKGKDGK
jgi:uncharacterized protein DUF4405